MPMYPFETKTGAATEVFMPFDEAVPIGEWKTIDGIRMKRLPSMPQFSVSPELRVTGYTMANDHPALDSLGLARDADNNPLFDGQRDIDRFNTESQRLNDKDQTIPAFGWDKE